MLDKTTILIHSLLKQHQMVLKGLNDGGLLFELAFPVPLLLSLTVTHAHLCEWIWLSQVMTPPSASSVPFPFASYFLSYTL